MAHPITLFTGQRADLPFERVAELAAGWGYDGLEIACSGDHLDVDRGAVDDAYIAGRRDVLKRHGLEVFAISAHLQGQAVCDDPIDVRHRGILSADVWGDGDPEGVRGRAAEAMKNAARTAARLGVDTVVGFTGNLVMEVGESVARFRFIIRDRARQFTASFDAVLAAVDRLGDWRTELRAPRIRNVPPRRRHHPDRRTMKHSEVRSLVERLVITVVVADEPIDLGPDVHVVIVGGSSTRRPLTQPFPAARLRPDDAALLLQTSGSAGEPRRVLPPICGAVRTRRRSHRSRASFRSPRG